MRRIVELRACTLRPQFRRGNCAITQTLLKLLLLLILTINLSYGNPPKNNNSVIINNK